MRNHDRLFKELISTFFVEFLDLFLPEVLAYLDARSIEFMDKEIFTDVTSGERLEPDLVVKVKFKGIPSFFIIHVENQASPERSFGRRLFRYFSRLHDKYDLPVYPIVVFSFDSPRKPQADAYSVRFPNKVVHGIPIRCDSVEPVKLAGLPEQAQSRCSGADGKDEHSARRQGKGKIGVFTAASHAEVK